MPAAWKNLQWLFTGTLLGMIAVNPPFAALVARLPRVRFIAISYRFFAANLAALRTVSALGQRRAEHLDRPGVFYLDVGF